MAYPNSSGTKCPKCGNTSFELVQDFPSKANYKMYYIRCSSCNTFLQALPYNDTNSLIDNIHKEIKTIESLVRLLNGNIADVGNLSARNIQILQNNLYQKMEEIKKILQGEK